MNNRQAAVIKIHRGGMSLHAEDGGWIFPGHLPVPVFV
jgi:hypothetical protein